MDKFDKATKLTNYLKINNLLSSFNINEQEDQVTFIVEEAINGINVKCLISITEGSLRSDIAISVALKTNIDKRASLLNIINEINIDSLLIKVVLFENGDVMAMIPYVSTNDEFNADTLINIVWVGMKQIAENIYPKIMQANWQ